MQVFLYQLNQSFIAFVDGIDCNPCCFHFPFFDQPQDGHLEKQNGFHFYYKLLYPSLSQVHNVVVQACIVLTSVDITRI